MWLSRQSGGQKDALALGNKDLADWFVSLFKFQSRELNEGYMFVL